MNAAIILAGGRGDRFNADRPKQFLEFAGRPLLSHCIETFQKSPHVDSFCVVARAGWEEEARDRIREVDRREETFVVTGGATRRESVLRGLKPWEDRDPETVFIHDGARPGVTTDLISALRTEWENRSAPGVIPVLPVNDTLKEIDPESGMVENTPVRERFRRVQTPQLFSYRTILEAHRTVPDDVSVTDDASLLEAKGKAVATVAGEPLNLKVTYPRDLILLEQLIERRQS